MGDNVDTLGMSAHVLIALLTPLLAQSPVPTFRSDVTQIRVDVQVLTSEHSAEGLALTKSEFRVMDNGREQPIVGFASEDQVLDVMLLLDVSSSTVPIEAKIKSAAIEALTHVGPGDRVGATFFHSRTFLATGPTLDRELFKKRLTGIPWGGDGTDLNSAILNAALYLGRNGRPEARKAVVILTDNVGFKGTSDESVQAALWDNDVILSALIFPARQRSDAADVRPFVEATGGDVMRVETDVITFGVMFRRLRERYVLFYAAPPRDTVAIHTIKVELTGDAKASLKNPKVRARQGYRMR